MADPRELEARFWKALEKDRTVMLGLDGVPGGHLQPMTAIAEGDRAPIWFFTASDTDLARRLSSPQAGLMAFAAKGHDLFATAQGELRIDNDRAVIDRLWNAFVAAWFEGGKDDPKVTLLRFDAVRAEVWLNENSLLAGVKMLLGADPKQDYRDKVGGVDLR